MISAAIGAETGQAMENERRSADARWVEHDRRLTLVEGKVETLAPKVVVMEQVHALREGQAELSNEIRSVTGTLKNLTDQVSSLANEIKTAFSRISEINETHMVNLARQADELHKQQLAEKEAEIEKMKQEVENRKLGNQVKYWSGLFGGIVAILTALFYLITLFSPLLNQAK